MTYAGRFDGRMKSSACGAEAGQMTGRWDNTDRDGGFGCQRSSGRNALFAVCGAATTVVSLGTTATCGFKHTSNNNNNKRLRRT